MVVFEEKLREKLKVVDFLDNRDDIKSVFDSLVCCLSQLLC